MPNTHLHISTITSRDQGGGSKKAGLPPSANTTAFAKGMMRLRSTYKPVSFVNSSDFVPDTYNDYYALPDFNIFFSDGEPLITNVVKNSNGLVTSFDTNEGTFSVTYNTNNLIQSVGPVDFTYVSGTSKIQSISFFGIISFQVTYDSLGRIITISDTSGIININYIYYGNSFIIKSINLNNTPTITYTDVLNGLPSITDFRDLEEKFNVSFDRNTTSNLYFIFNIILFLEIILESILPPQFQTG